MSFIKVGKTSVPDETSNTYILGQCFDTLSGTPVIAVARSHFQFPQVITSSGFAKNVSEPFMPAFWAVQETDQIDRANCKRSVHTVAIKLQGKSSNVNIPIIVNNRHIDAGEDILLFKRQKSEVEPPVHHKRKSEPLAKKGAKKVRGSAR